MMNFAVWGKFGSDVYWNWDIPYPILYQNWGIVKIQIIIGYECHTVFDPLSS